MLLVDDDPDFARVFQISLRADKRVSFEIENASTLESALKILREKTFQLILKLSFLDSLTPLINRRGLQRMVSPSRIISNRSMIPLATRSGIHGFPLEARGHDMG